MPSAPKYRFIECDGETGPLRLAIGADRVAVQGLRPQAEQLIRYMILQEEANGPGPRIYSYAELQDAVWGPRQMSDGKGQIARLVFEIRQVLGPPADADSLIASVPGKGYMLVNGAGRNAKQSTPFVCGPPIAHPSGFFGREAELKRIFAIWKRVPVQNIAVIGPRRSGKTSLFHYLERIHLTPTSQLRPRQARYWTPGPEGHRVVFIDCQDARLRTPAAVLEHILKQLGTPAAEPCSEAVFVETLARISCRTILLFDEFDAALANPAFDAGFWAGLRSLATNYTRGLLGLAIALHEEPAEALAARDPQSPFLNIFGHTLTLGPMAENEALELIRSSPRAFAEEDEEWILAQSGRHPCLLQLLCDTRLHALENEHGGDAWKAEGLARIKRFAHLLHPA